MIAAWSSRFCFLLVVVVVFLPFFGLLPRHMEVPRLGVELELQLMASATATVTQDLICVCNLHHSSQQCWILNPLSKTRDRSYNLMVPSGVH